MGISSYIIGILTGIIIAAVGLEEITQILKEALKEVIPIFLTLVEGLI